LTRQHLTLQQFRACASVPLNDIATATMSIPATNNNLRIIITPPFW
jgi:hypothetical protein